jgi:hypothetical protein
MNHPTMSLSPKDYLPKKKKVNKFLYGWKLYVNYGQGWEYETFEETLKSYVENRKAYRDNCKYPQKWVKSREPNPEYKGE